MAEKVSKSSVHYRSGNLSRRCGNCSMFQKPDGCTLVEGKIAARALCDDWEQQK